MKKTDPSVFSQRRARLAQLLRERHVDSVALVSGWARPRNFAHNVFPFRAESHFLYLIGEHLEGAALLWEEGAWSLVLSETEPEMALWLGEQPSAEEWAERLGIAVRYWREVELGEEWATLPPQDEETALWWSDVLGREVVAQSGAELSGSDASLAEALVELRLVHDAAAIEQLRAAARGSAWAHLVGMQGTRGAEWEYQVRGKMEGALLQQGMQPAYTSIVTTRGDVLHQPESWGRLAPGSLLLCDVGGETREGWAGDVTRTWPVSGRFSSTQRELYSLVLQVKQSAIAGVRPGVRYLDLHKRALLQLGQGLLDLGLIRGEVEELYARGVLAVFCPHGLGHLLGLDVHDMEDLGDRAGYEDQSSRSEHPCESSLRLDRVLQAHQVVTIEPGVYLSPLLLARARSTPELSSAICWEELARFQDVPGIRIEDDVLVTEGAPEVLSQGAPQELDDVERALS